MPKPSKKAAPAATPVPALPSILELGKMMAACSREHNRLNELQIAAKDADYTVQEKLTIGMALQDERYFALRDLICTMPPTSLAECAIQLSIANALAVHLGGDEPDKDEAAKTLERITVSVISVVAAAAGLDMVELDLDQYVDLCDRRFPAVSGGGSAI